MILQVVFNAIRAMDGLLVDMAVDGSVRLDRFRDALVSVKAGLAVSAEVEVARVAEADLARASELSVIMANGGLEDDRTIFMFHLLFKEFGPRLLSDEGIQRLAGCIREP